jgi:hypothetical protein
MGPTGSLEVRSKRGKYELRCRRASERDSKVIHHFLVFESERALPANDLRVEVPNGRPKLIVPFRNGLTASATSICGSITRRVTLS